MKNASESTPHTFLSQGTDAEQTFTQAGVRSVGDPPLGSLDADEARQLHTASDGSADDPLDDHFSSNLFDPTQKRLGRYVILEELGRGGMGVVHAAYDERLGRKVAIKIVRDPEETSRREQARLVREAQAMAQVTHPNIVTIFDVGKSAEGVFLAMEYVPGQTLQDYLETDQPAWRIIRTFIEAGRGLIAAHEQGIVHRDFKPSNVLIGRDGRVKVADFGLAAIDAESNSSDGTSTGARDSRSPQMTQAGARIGTPSYMAPEQHLGQVSTGLSDQFSFCVALWEGLYGTHPFPAATQFARAERVTSGRIEAPPQPGRATETIRKILEKGLSRAPEERHRSMKELVSLLEASLTHGVSPQSQEQEQSPEWVDGAKPLLGRYRVLDPHPASSLLHVALDRLTGTFLAVQWAGGQKFDTPEAHAETQLSDQFRALDGVQHPHIVAVIDFGYDVHYGAFLAYALSRDALLIQNAARRASFDAQVNYLMDILRAVGFLHDRKIYGFGLTAQDVVVSGTRAQLLVQFPPRSQRLDPETAKRRDMSSLSNLALTVLRGERSGSGERPLTWDAPGIDPNIARVFSHLGGEGDNTTAAELARELSAAVGRKLNYETPETREAALRSISLVGRGSALRTFKAGLLSAIDSKGSLCIISGESGIGKSRFVEECRTICLDSGNRFYCGQAESASAVAYQIWQSPFRQLAVETNIGDFEASVLAWLIPDIAQLLGRSVIKAPELDGPAMRDRLTQVAQALFNRGPRALVIALEDLQWADPDSISLLESLQEGLLRTRVLILGTIRSEEDADLTSQIHADEVIHLRALGEESVLKLCKRVLHNRNEAIALADYVFRHSEGNPLFVAEVFRALADEAGSLSEISGAALPQSPRTGGLRRAIQQRLQRLPDEALPLLQMAAVYGRKFDPQILEAACPDEQVSAWLGLVRTPAIVEQHSDAWRFSHDKVREAVLEQIPLETKKTLHLAIAGAILKVHGDQQAPLLAHHFRKADDDRAARYSGLAGETCVHSSPEEAVRLLTQAIELAGPLDQRDLPRWGRLLAEALFDQGRVPEAAQKLESVCAASSSPLPNSRLGWYFSLFFAVAVQLLHVITKRSARAASKVDSSELVFAYDKLAEIYFFQAENQKALTLCLLALNESDKTGAIALNSLGIVAQTAEVLRLRQLARAYFSRGRAALQKDPSLFHPTFFLTETFAHAALGHFDEARASALRGFELGKNLGHSLGASQCLSALGLVEFNEGKFEHMLSRYESIFRYKSYNAEHDAGPSGGASTAHAMLGNESAARRFGEQALRGASGQIPIMASAIHAGQALVLTRLGKHQEACREADLATESLDVTSLPSVLTPSLIGPMLAYLNAWREARDNEPSLVKDYRRQAQKQLARLRKFSRLYPMAEAFYSLAQGQLALLQGKPRAAQRAFLRGLAQAHKRKLRHCEGLLHTEIARLMPRGTSARELHLDAATTVFQELSTTPDLKIVQTLKQTPAAA